MQLYQPTITGSLAVSGSVSVSGSITIVGGGSIAGTASIATTALTASSADNFLTRGTLTAQTIVVQTITSSVDFVTGSTRFGSLSENTHQFTGSVSISGSLATSIAALGSAASLFLVSDGNVIKSRTAAQTLSDIAALPLTGGTLTGALSGTSATFSGKLSVSQASTDFVAEFINTANATPYGLRIKDAASPANNYPLFSVSNNAGSTEYFRVNSGTGTATFSSSVTAASAAFNTSVIVGNVSSLTGAWGNLTSVLQLGNSTTDKGYISVNEISGDDDINIVRYAYFDNTNWKRIGGGNPSRYSQRNAEHSFQYASSGADNSTITWNNALYIGNNGNVGIGTTTINDKLDVYGNIRTSINTSYYSVSNYLGINYYLGSSETVDNIDFKINGGGTFTSGGNFRFWTQTGNTTPVERMRITSGGSVAVTTGGNKTEGTAQFYIDGSGYAAYHWLDATAYYIGQNSSLRELRMYSGATTAGVKLTNGSTSWGTYSDERLKTNIEDIGSVLDKVKDLRTVKYHLKDVDANDRQKRYGLIAQDLVGKFDEVLGLSKYSDELPEEYYDLRYTELVPILVKAIQELSAQIEELKTEFNEYKSTHP